MVARALSIAAALACVQPGLAAAQATALDAPVVWTLEQSDARCVVTGRYGSAKDPVTLAFKAAPIGDTIQMAIIGRGIRRPAVQSEAKLKLGDEVIETTSLTYPLAARQRVTTLINLSAEQSTVLRRAREVRVQVNRAVDETFSLDSAAAAWARLDDCTQNLARTWNIGPEWEAKIRTTAAPITPLNHLFTERDYPLPAVHQHQGGTTAMLLLIDEHGSVKDCTLVQSSGVASIDARSCGVIIVRGKFRPAVGNDGKPIKSALLQRITWRMER